MNNCIEFCVLELWWIWFMDINGKLHTSKSSFIDSRKKCQKMGRPKKLEKWGKQITLKLPYLISLNLNLKSVLRVFAMNAPKWTSKSLIFCFFDIWLSIPRFEAFKLQKHQIELKILNSRPNDLRNQISANYLKNCR